MTNSVPNTPQVIYDKNSSSLDSTLVKIAEPQYITTNEEPVSAEIMTSLVFEDIGGQEIINLDRNDTVFGSNITYQFISNNNQILQTYNSYTMAPIHQTSYEYFKNFPIRIDFKIPNVGNGENENNIYIDDLTGDLVIEFVNIENDEQIEINILNSGNSIYDTI